MTDNAIIGRNVDVLQTNVADSGFSWGAAVAGAIAATAVSFLFIALGSGVGFLAASPYSSGPSAGALTAGGAIWIVLAQTWGFAVGGYLAGRLRATSGAGPSGETDFRDGAHGFVAWSLGVLLTGAMALWVGLTAVGVTGHVASSVGLGAASLSQTRTGGAGDRSAYYADALFRGIPQQTAAPTQPARPQADVAARSEVERIFAAATVGGGLSEDDRNYLGRVVGDRTSLTPEEANRRVSEVETRMKAAAKEAADKAAKAASLLSFWTFMSLLMGAAAAVVGGIVGGNHRDEHRPFARGS